MRAMIAIALLLIIGRVSAEPIGHDVSVVRDSKRGVTCWIFSGMSYGGISCPPDSQLIGKPSQTSGADQDQPTPASTPTPRRQEEVFQL